MAFRGYRTAKAFVGLIVTEWVLTPERCMSTLITYLCLSTFTAILIRIVPSEPAKYPIVVPSDTPK